MFASIQKSPCFVIAWSLVCQSAMAPSRRTPLRGGTYALLIGVNKYDHVAAIKRVENLSFAETRRRTTRPSPSHREVEPDAVITMTTAAARDDERYPTAANIRKLVKATAGRLLDGDSVVMSFSGYEMQFAGDDDYYLCPADAAADDVHSLVSLREVAAVFDGAKGTGKLLIIDSCRSLEQLAGERPSRRGLRPRL